MDGRPPMGDEEKRLRRAKQQERAQRKAVLNVDQLVVAPQRHISVDASELKLALRGRLPVEERPEFDDLCKLVEGVASFDFWDLKRRMREEFLPFASGAKNQTYLQRSSRPLPSTVHLDTKEEDFIADVYEVLRASHYHLLTRDEWEIATAEDFQLSLPVEVNWEYMDNQMLTKLWASNEEYKEIRDTLPDELADRILVFHRGVGTATMSGLLIDQKLDLLMNYTVFRAIDAVKAKFQSFLDKRKAAADKKAAGPAAAAAKQAAPAVNRSSSTGLPRSSSTGLPRSSSMGPPGVHLSHGTTSSEGRHLSRNHSEMGTMQGSSWVQSTHKFAKTVERHTLARQCPTVLTLLQSFPKKMELQEPTFKDIIVLYRKALPARQPPKASNRQPSKTEEERMQGILNYRNIVLKVFGETAMADMEVVFPDKKVSIKPFQLVNMAITVGMALVTFALTLWKAGDKMNMNVVWTAASLIGTRLFTVYTSAQTQRTTMQQEMSAMLYDKMEDSGSGVVTVIMEEMADQQIKQMLMAYVLLLSKCGPESRGLLPMDLDTACENFLVKDFNHAIDFEVDAALSRLKRWTLVKETAEGRLVPMPLKEAISTLESAWQEAYKVIGTSSNQATRDLIDGTGSTFGKGIDAFRKKRDVQIAAEKSAAEKAARTTLAKTKDAMGGLLGKKAKEGSSSHHKEVNGHSSSAGYTTGEAAPMSDGLERANSGESSASVTKKKKSLFKKLLQ